MRINILKLLHILILIITLFFGCDKDDKPTSPDESPENNHDQGKSEILL